MPKLNKKNTFFQVFSLILFVFAFSACMQQSAEQADSGGQAAPNTEQAKNAPGPDQADFPTAKDWVNDFAGLFEAGETEKLNRLIKEYESKTGVEIAVVSVEEYDQSQNFKSWLKDLANNWGVGKQQTNNGIVIGISKKTRESAIVTGLEMKQRLSDAKCKSILESQLVPSMKKGEPFKGVMASLEMIFAELEN